MKRLITISPTIRTLFKTIQTIINIHIQPEIIDQILTDCESNQVNEKFYQLSGQKDKVNLIGIVDEYEPETIWMRFENINRSTKTKLEQVFYNYDFAFGIGSEFRSENESVEIFNKGIEQIKILKIKTAHNNGEHEEPL